MFKIMLSIINKYIKSLKSFYIAVSYTCHFTLKIKEYLKFFKFSFTTEKDRKNGKISKGGINVKFNKIYSFNER